jgi:DNA primase
LNVEELLQDKNIQYKYSGGDLVIKCLNPEHDDTNPSMRVDKITGKFHCFSCGFGGNIYKLFRIQNDIINSKILELKEKISAFNTPRLNIPLSADIFNLEFRGIKGETYSRFKAFRDINDKDFEGRIVFPVLDAQDNIICFHGRYMYSDADPKYLTKPSKVKLPLYPAYPDEIINGSIILVEGFFDMLNLYDKGLKNAVCSFGVSLVSRADKGNAKLKRKFSHLKLQGVSKIYILFDGDKAGRDGAKKLKEALKDSYSTEILDLDDGVDPGSLNQEDVNYIKSYLYDKNSNS